MREIKVLAILLKVNIQHVPRSFNLLANWVSKWSVDQREEFCGEGLPEC